MGGLRLMKTKCEGEAAAIHIQQLIGAPQRSRRGQKGGEDGWGGGYGG